jgi:hypothetical protein
MTVFLCRVSRPFQDHILIRASTRLSSLFFRPTTLIDFTKVSEQNDHESPFFSQQRTHRLTLSFSLAHTRSLFWQDERYTTMEAKKTNNSDSVSNGKFEDGGSKMKLKHGEHGGTLKRKVKRAKSHGKGYVRQPKTELEEMQRQLSSALIENAKLRDKIDFLEEEKIDLGIDLEMEVEENEQLRQTIEAMQMTYE